MSLNLYNPYMVTRIGDTAGNDIQRLVYSGYMDDHLRVESTHAYQKNLGIKNE
jgi:hypothetical protein